MRRDGIRIQKLSDILIKGNEIEGPKGGGQIPSLISHTIDVTAWIVVILLALIGGASLPSTLGVFIGWDPVGWAKQLVFFIEALALAVVILRTVTEGGQR